MKHVWKGHGADSEIGNVFARQAALNRWTATDKRWKKKTVSRGSVVTSVKRLPICVRNSWALELTRPRVSMATGKRSWVRQSIHLFKYSNSIYCNHSFNSINHSVINIHIRRLRSPVTRRTTLGDRAFAVAGCLKHPTRLHHLQTISQDWSIQSIILHT